MNVEEMESVLKGLGIEVVGSRGWEVQGMCPGHKERTGHEDRNPSWYINSDSGAHICFSCGFKGNLNSLISYMGGAPIDEEYDVQKQSSSILKRLMAAISPKEKPKDEPTPITESMLAAFVSPPDEALLARGLTREAAIKYEVLWDRLNNNWVLPVRDPDGKLLGWQEKGYSTRFFNNYPKGVKKGHCLFGYGNYTSGTMVVVESPLDVVRLASVGVDGAVAAYGCGITNAQFNAIRGADKVIFALDNDTAGITASKNMLQMCLNTKTEAWFFNYDHTDMKDVGGMSKSEILSGLETARHIITYGRMA